MVELIVNGKIPLGTKSKVTNSPELCLTSTTPSVKMESLLVLQVIDKVEQDEVFIDLFFPIAELVLFLIPDSH